MSRIRHAINAGLRRSTGYVLTKADSTPPRQQPSASPANDVQRLARLANRLERSVTRLEQVRGSKASATPTAKPVPALPADFDDAIKETIELVRPFTMTSPDKLHALITAVRYVEDAKVPGAIVECGVWRGGSMHAVARTLDRYRDHDRELYLFDTYAGMTEPTERDQSLGGSSAADLLEKSERTSWVWAVASIEDVQQGFEQVPYPMDRLHFVEGDVEKTIPSEAPDQIALLRLDTDWYESTRHELEHLYDRLQPGGVLIIDDYGSWQGSKEATDEWLAALDRPLLMLRAGRGRVALKPF